MKISREKGLNDIEKIKNYLTRLGFICRSQSSSQNLIYSKKEHIIIIKNEQVDIK